MRNIDQYRCIALVGGGGKTSLMFYLTGLFVKKGKKVVVASSTHIGFESERPFALWGEDEKLRENLLRYGYSVVGIMTDRGVKISAPEDACFGRFFEYADVVLVEADGAKRLPLKVPAEYEPVIPKEADLIIAVTGMDAVGGRIEKCCHRPELVAALLGKSPKDVITPEDMAYILCHPRGMRKDVGERDYKVVLNKADNRMRREYASRIREMIFKRLGERPGLSVEITALQRKTLGVILLAAGSSRRFGKENKLLYEVEGRSLFERTIETMASLHCGFITVVTQYEEVARIAEAYGARVLYNPHPEEGIASSIRIGVQGSKDAKAWLLSVCDQPYMSQKSLEDLINCYFSQGKGIASMYSGGRIVNPAIISASYEKELLALVGDVGGRQVILRHREDTALSLVEDERELLDMDTPPLTKSMK